MREGEKRGRTVGDGAHRATGTEWVRHTERQGEERYSQGDRELQDGERQRRGGEGGQTPATGDIETQRQW